MFICAGVYSFSESTPVPSLYSYKLKNGLSLFVAENHSVPLTYIEIAVRCGAYTQEKETSGLFHLYEHMMFKGNSLYKDAASVTCALNDMGVAEWNGTTDVECVNYYFTVPSEMTKQGLEFWNAAIRTPKLDKTELENEKKVVLSEIQANFANKGRVYYTRQNELMFSEAPYKLSSSGSLDVVQNATVEQLKQIQKQFYIPNNAALFVGGDVNPDEVYAMVQKIYGSWKKGKTVPAPFRFTKEPVSSPVYKVLPYDKISEQIAQIEVIYRGPDCYYDQKDTYTADILGYLMANPEGLFKTSLVQNPLLFVPSPDYVGAAYYTRKTCGLYRFSFIVQNPASGLCERSFELEKELPQLIDRSVQATSQKELEEVCTIFEDQNEWGAQTATGILSTLRFWWISADENYYYDYVKNLKSVTVENMAEFNQKYFYNKAPLICVWVNPLIYEKCKADFEKNGFELFE